MVQCGHHNGVIVIVLAFHAVLGGYLERLQFVMEPAAAVRELIRALNGDRILVFAFLATADMRVQFVLRVQVAEIDIFIARELTNDHTPVEFLVKCVGRARLPRLDGAQRTEMLLRRVLIMRYQVPEYLLRSISVKVAPPVIQKLPSVEKYVSLYLLIRMNRFAVNGRRGRPFNYRVVRILPALTCGGLLLNDEIFLTSSLFGHETFVEESYQKLVLARCLIWLVFEAGAQLGRVANAVRIFLVQSPRLVAL